MTIKELIHYLNYSGNQTDLPVVFRNKNGAIFKIEKLVIKQVEDIDENIFKALVMESK